MIGYRFLIGAIALWALAPIVSNAAEVSGNDIVQEDIVEDVEDPVPDQEVVEPDYMDDPELLVPDDNYDVGDVIISDDPLEPEDDYYSVSGNDVDYSDQIRSVLDEYGIEPMANYDTYYGSISSTYLEYMRGYIPKLQPDEHYVASRVGQYDYIIAMGSDLVYDASSVSFSGSDIYVVRWNTRDNGTFSASIETTFSLDPGSYLVYSDLSPRYPTLVTSSDVSLRQLVLVAGMLIVFYTVTQFGRSNGVRRKRGGSRI